MSVKEDVNLIVRIITKDHFNPHKMNSFMKTANFFLRKDYDVNVSYDILPNGIILYYFSEEDYINMEKALVALHTIIRDGFPDEYDAYQTVWNAVIEKNTTGLTSKEIFKKIRNSHTKIAKKLDNIKKTDKESPQDVVYEYSSTSFEHILKKLISLYKERKSNE